MTRNGGVGSLEGSSRRKQKEIREEINKMLDGVGGVDPEQVVPFLSRIRFRSIVSCFCLHLSFFVLPFRRH